MPTLTADELAPWVNAYTIRAGPPKAIVVPNASRLAALQDVTVSGNLLRKQTLAIDARSGRRTAALGANDGAYGIEADGDLHVCLGVKPLQPHITCELQHAAAWLPTFRARVGQPITASGFFRCLFEHPGFDVNDDAHVFEIHPVRAVSLGGKSQAFDVELPDPNSIHTWLSPHPLNLQDERIRVSYDRATDTLTFRGMDGQDENYVRVPGVVSQVKVSSGGAPSTFLLSSGDVGYPLQVLALPGSRAAMQVARLATTSVSLVGVRSIDLSQSLAGKYVIRLVAIDIQPGP